MGVLGVLQIHHKVVNITTLEYIVCEKTIDFLGPSSEFMFSEGIKLLAAHLSQLLTFGPTTPSYLMLGMVCKLLE